MVSCASARASGGTWVTAVHDNGVLILPLRHCVTVGELELEQAVRTSRGMLEDEDWPAASFGLFFLSFNFGSGWMGRPALGALAEGSARGPW